MVLNKRKITTLTLDKVAWLVGTNRETVLRWTDAGILKPYSISGNSEKVFKRKDVAKLLVKLGV